MDYYKMMINLAVLFEELINTYAYSFSSMFSSFPFLYNFYGLPGLMIKEFSLLKSIC